MLAWSNAAEHMILRAVSKRLPIAVGLAGQGCSPREDIHHSKAAHGSAKISERGGTLVETVVALVILSIAAAGILGSINYGMFMMRLARENGRATQVMLEKLETIRLYDWDEVTTSGFVPATFTNVYDPQGAPGQQGAVYAGTMTVSNVPFATSYSANLMQFTVTVSWTTAGQINHYRELSTLVARDGIQNYVY
jgi:type II secretory pathway pseudopilin PulG